MELSKVILKLGISMLKSYNQDNKAIEDYGDYLAGEIDENYYLNFISKGKYYKYIYDFERFIGLLSKEENNKELLLKNFKIIKCIIGDMASELYINVLLDGDTDLLYELINKEEINLKFTINYLCASIQLHMLFKDCFDNEYILMRFLKGAKGKLEAEKICEILKFKKASLLHTQKNSSNELSYNILMNIYNLCEFLVSEKGREELFTGLLEVFREEKGREAKFSIEKITDRNVGALTNSCYYLIVFLAFVDIENEDERDIVKTVIEDNGILKLERLFRKLYKEDTEIAISLLRKALIPEHLILCGYIESLNPLNKYSVKWDSFNWKEEDILKAYNIFKESKNYESLYILTLKLSEDEEKLEELSKRMFIEELNKKSLFQNVEEEVELLLKGEELTSDFIYSLDRAEQTLSYSRTIGAFCLGEYKPVIFKRYLSLIYVRENVASCRNVNNALSEFDISLKNFHSAYNYYKSIGVDEKLWLQMHLIKLRQGFNEDLSAIYKENYESVIEILVENKIYNWDYWLNEIYETVGDSLLKLSSIIINTGNTDAIKFIIEKLSGNKKYYKILTSNTNLEDLNVRKGIVNYVISIEHKEKEEFLKNLLKTETSKVIKDTINRYIQNTKLMELGQGSSGKEYVISIVNGDKDVNKGLTKFDFTVAPKLRWEKDGEISEEKITRYILKAYLNNKDVKKNPSINFIAKLLNKEDLERLAYYVLNIWLSTGAEAKERWILGFVGEYGGGDSLSLLFSKIKDFADNSRHAMALESLNALTLSKNDMAIVYINSIAIKFKYRKIKERANECLDLAALNRGISRADLEDIIIPTLGFNERGEKELSYGERNFTIKLNLDNTLQIIDSKGKVFKSLPKGNKSDNEEMVKSAEKEFKQLKKDLKNTVDMQLKRLNEALGVKRYWTTESFTKVFMENPIMTKFALGLIWGVYEKNDLKGTFRYMEDGSLTSYDEDDFELPKEGEIALVHPIELSEEEINGWKEQLEDYEIEQPLLQINRPIYTISDELLDNTVYEEFNNIMVNGNTLYGRLNKLSWDRSSIEDAGFYYGLIKKIDGELCAVLETDGISVSYYDGYETKIGNLKLVKNGKDVQLNTISKRILSEIIYDLKRSL